MTGSQVGSSLNSGGLRGAAVTSRIMAAIRGKDNRTEVWLRRQLHARGLRYRLHARRLVGSPDIVFPRSRVAVFVDGDFWHGRMLLEGGTASFEAHFKTPRRQFWRQKLEANIARDKLVTETLRSQGWEVVRLWESDIIASPPIAVELIESSVRLRQLAVASVAGRTRVTHDPPRLRQRLKRRR
jgi:DNA mismatch endonuclease, patch repair protein